MDEGALPITADVRVFIHTHTHIHTRTVGEASDCTTDTEEFNNLKNDQTNPTVSVSLWSKEDSEESG